MTDSPLSDLPSGTELAGTRAVVTGSASGIGRAIAKELAAAGAQVMLHARANDAQLKRVVTEIQLADGQASSRLADFSSPAECRSFVADCWDQLGQVDIWVNNAGVDVLTGSLAEVSFAEKLESLWQVDVRSTIQLSRDVGSRMKTAGGVILNMGWDQAEVGQAGNSGELFAATKGAVMAFSRSLAKSLAPHVRVNCLAPGWIKTSWGESTTDAWNDRARGESLLGRWGAPADVARVARFLVSPAASFVNGQIIAINGGSQPWPRCLTDRFGLREDDSHKPG